MADLIVERGGTMNFLRHTLYATAVLVTVFTSFVTPAEAMTLCDRLATEAQRVPPNVWESGSEKALAHALKFAPQQAKLSLLETRLADLSWVKEAISADGGWAIFIERMPGTDVYMASTVQGTLHCQTSTFLEARPNAKPNPIAAPMEFEEGDGCWTRSGDFGRVFDHPAFIAHGSLNDHTDDEDISIVPWTGTGWGKSCKVGFRFRKAFALTQTYCGDRDVCRAGSAIAVDVATAYAKARLQDSAPLEFQFGSPASKAALDSVRRATDKLGSDTSVPDFPTFGATGNTDTPSYSYSGFGFFPLALNGRYYVGAIGYDGVGWRESNRTLFAIFSEDRGDLTPLAGFEVDFSNGGLISAKSK